MTNPRAHPRDDFYVGYLPLPWSHSRFLRVAIPATLWALVFIALAVAAVQRDPGPAVWNDTAERTWEGVLHVTPYPMLAVEAGDDRGLALLVQQGKRGALDRCISAEPRRVRLRGWRLERDGRRIIELSPEQNAITPIDGSAPASLSLARHDTVEIAGEIMDAKCYLGAMKPGDGMGHKSCAMLCLRGGIPPMLVSRSGSGAATYHLMLSDKAGPMPDDLILLAGEPVTVSGVEGTIGDLPVILVHPGGVHRGS